MIGKLNDKGRMADVPLSPEATITVERRGEIVLHSNHVKTQENSPRRCSGESANSLTTAGHVVTYRPLPNL
jgi:hypothetical protein